MKTTTNKTTIELAKRLEIIINVRKGLNEEEAEIKAALKDIMASFETNILQAGEIVVIVSDRVRTDLNKEKIMKLLGEDIYKECLTKSKYQILELKKETKPVEIFKVKKK